MRISGLHFRRCVRSPLFWLAVLYVAVGVLYARITPLFEKPDEYGHYGYILYLREYHALPPLLPLSARSSVGFRQADQAYTRSQLAWELHQPPLYYVATALLTSWLPDDPDPDQFFDRNPLVGAAAPGYRNDNRNYFLHPPDMTPLVLGARLVSLLFGLGTLLASYFLAAQLLPKNSLVPIATAAIVGFQPSFMFVATAANNDSATAFFGTLALAILMYRLKRGSFLYFAVLLGGTLGLAGLTKVNALVFFPLAGLALMFIHRGFRRDLFRDGIIIMAVAVLVSGWWYTRNAVLYRDPLLMSAHPMPGSDMVVWSRLKHDLLSIEFTFWANQSVTFNSPIGLDKALIWWGRISLGLLALSLLVNYRPFRANLPALLLLLGWPLAFLFLLIVYWNPRTLLPWGRFLFPAIAPTILTLVLGWHYALSPPRKRLAAVALRLCAGMVVIIGSMVPFLTLYPVFHPSREWHATQVEHPVNTVYSDSQTGIKIARLIGYNLPKPYALPGADFPIELCWEPLGRTDAPYAVFVQLLDLSQLNAHETPAAWGRRETYPGLGNRPTDRWELYTAFCDTVFVRAFPETPAPAGTAIEVGLSDPEHTRQLQAVDSQNNPIDLAIIGHVPILSPTELPTVKQPMQYILDNALGLSRIQVSQDLHGTIVLTLTWQALRSVPYDATIFIHVREANGNILAQVDRQPWEGRFPTSLWLPGQIVTDTIHLALPPDARNKPLELNLGMYTWPSLQRLPMRDASGTIQPDNMAVLDVPLDIHSNGTLP